MCASACSRQPASCGRLNSQASARKAPSCHERSRASEALLKLSKRGAGCAAALLALLFCGWVARAHLLSWRFWRLRSEAQPPPTCGRLLWTDTLAASCALEDEPAAPSWLEAHLAPRTVLLLAFIIAPRTAALLALSGGQEDTLALMLGARGVATPASAAAASVRAAAAHMLAPRCTQAHIALAALWPSSRALACLAAACLALKGVLACLALPRRVAIAVNAPGDALLGYLFGSAFCGGGLLLLRGVLAYAPPAAAKGLLAGAIGRQLHVLSTEAAPWLAHARALLRLRRLMRAAPPSAQPQAEQQEAEAAEAAEAAAAEPRKVKWPSSVPLPAHAEAEMPSHLRCPITMGPLREPAVTTAGLTYERGALLRWVKAHGTEPTLRSPLKMRHCVPNYLARAAVEEWARAHPRPADAQPLFAPFATLEFAPGADSPPKAPRGAPRAKRPRAPTAQPPGRGLETEAAQPLPLPLLCALHARPNTADLD